MSRFIFPYGIRLLEDGRIEVFPAAEIFVGGHKGRGMRTTFHIDSGATTSIMPSADALLFGIRLKQGKKMLVRGISGIPLVGYRHILTFQFDGAAIKAPVLFVEENKVPRVLGREILFPHFGIVFDELKKRVAFLDERKDIDALFE